MLSPILKAAFLSGLFVAPAADSVDQNSTFFTESQICQSIISTVIDRDPKTMRTEKVDDNIVTVLFIRPEDGQKWRYQCQLDGLHARWWSEGETWQQAQDNSEITYTTLRDKLYIVETFKNGSINSRTFKLGQYGM